MDASCSICLEEFNGNNSLIALMGCGHTFHKECIDLSLSAMPNSCPLCRRNVDALFPYLRIHITGSDSNINSNNYSHMRRIWAYLETECTRLENELFETKERLVVSERSARESDSTAMALRRDFYTAEALVETLDRSNEFSLIWSSRLDSENKKSNLWPKQSGVPFKTTLLEEKFNDTIMLNSFWTSTPRIDNNTSKKQPKMIMDNILRLVQLNLGAISQKNALNTHYNTMHLNIEKYKSELENCNLVLQQRLKASEQNTANIQLIARDSILVNWNLQQKLNEINESIRTLETSQQQYASKNNILQQDLETFKRNSVAQLDTIKVLSGMLGHRNAELDQLKRSQDHLNQEISQAKEKMLFAQDEVHIFKAQLKNSKKSWISLWNKE